MASRPSHATRGLPIRTDSSMRRIGWRSSARKRRRTRLWPGLADQAALRALQVANPALQAADGVRVQAPEVVPAARVLVARVKKAAAGSADGADAEAASSAVLAMISLHVHPAQVEFLVRSTLREAAQLLRVVHLPTPRGLRAPADQAAPAAMTAAAVEIVRILQRKLVHGIRSAIDFSA